MDDAVKVGIIAAGAIAVGGVITLWLIGREAKKNYPRAIAEAKKSIKYISPVGYYVVDYAKKHPEEATALAVGIARKAILKV